MKCEYHNTSQICFADEDESLTASKRISHAKNNGKRKAKKKKQKKAEKKIIVKEVLLPEGSVDFCVFLMCMDINITILWFIKKQSKCAVLA